MVLRNLTFVQLEQFESTLRYIVPDETNTLSLAEFTATLASLGMVCSVHNDTFTTTCTQ